MTSDPHASLPEALPLRGVIVLVGCPPFFDVNFGTARAKFIESLSAVYTERGCSLLISGVKYPAGNSWMVDKAFAEHVATLAERDAVLVSFLAHGHAAGDHTQKWCTDMEQRLIELLTDPEGRGAGTLVSKITVLTPTCGMFTLHHRGAKATDPRKIDLGPYIL